MPVIMGTAGHIDHGKTTLIKAISGIDCDRLKDEKKRGITIELGFAYLDLPNGSKLGIVDVPGHEKFIKNMVAGASGIDFVLLTIAADEGIMPQTREHLEICSLLGIEEGLVAVTKTDTVDQDLLELALEEIKDFISGTFLESSPIIPVSAHSFAGIQELRQALQDKIKKLENRQASDLFRLPIDRVFTMRGHGTVITGTLVSGEIKLGEDIVVYPQGKTSKVRAIQVHGDTVSRAISGQRTAINLHGLEVADLERGDWIASPGTLFPSKTWDLELNCLSSAPKPLKHRKEVHFHHGSKEVIAKVYFFDREQLESGEKSIAQVTFNKPMVGVCQDKCVLRSFVPLRTIAGGTILNPLGQRKRDRKTTFKRLQRLSNLESEQIILNQLEMQGSSGIVLSRLRIMTNLPQRQLNRCLQDLSTKQKIFLFDKEDQRYVSNRTVQDLSSSLLKHVQDFHKQNPMYLGISKPMLLSNWGKCLDHKLANFIIEKTIKTGILIYEKELLRSPEHQISLAEEQSKIKENLLKSFEQADITPPNLNKLLESLQINKKEALPVLKHLAEGKKLIKIKEEMFFTPAALLKIKKLVNEYFDKNENLSPTDFKELTGLSRKYSIPLLEYLDKEKITIRVGDVRKHRVTK